VTNWNSPFYNIALKDIRTLQRVQDCLSRIVTRSPRFTRSMALWILCIGFLSDIV